MSSSPAGYRVWRGTLSSFGSEADGKHVKKSGFVLQATDDGAVWDTLSADTYRILKRGGEVEIRAVDDAGDAVDITAYTDWQDTGNPAFRVTYTVTDNGTETTYTNEALTLYEMIVYPGSGEIDPLVESADVGISAITSKRIDTNIQSDNFVTGVSGWKIWRITGNVEFGDGTFRGTVVATNGEIANFGIGVIDANTISADSGNFRLNSATPFMTLGAATGFLVGTGFFVGKSAGFYSLHIGNPAGQYMSFNGATGQLYVSGTIAGTTDIGGTESNSWTINQDLTDTNVDLVFGRTTGGNATIRWNGSVINVLNTLQENGVIVAKQNRAVNTTGALSGGGDLSADRTLSLNTPGTLTVSSGNSAATNHTHAITSSSNPGASASLLATDASGFLNLVRLNVDTLADRSGGNLTIAPTGDLIFNPAGKDLLPTTNYDLNIGALSKKYLTLHAAELWVETLVAQNTLATIGGRILILPTNILIADAAPAATTIDVKYNNLASGDRIYLEANGAVEFMAVTSGATGIAGGYRYSVTRDLDASGANQWYAGDAVANTGQTGSGFIDLYSVRGVKASSEKGPTIVGNIRNSATYNDWTPHWAIGNLDGLYGYSGTTPGAALGKYASGKPNISVDDTNGIRIRNFTTVIGQWDTSGNITVGEVGASKSNVYITSNKVQLRTNTTVNVELDTAGKVVVGEIANSKARTEISAGQIDLIARTSGGADKTKFSVKTDGTVLIGTDISSPATTSLALFTGAQTYNGESVGDGDLLLGNNQASTGNLFWQKSSGELQFRIATTKALVLDAGGDISLWAGASNRKVNWKSSGGTLLADWELDSNQSLWGRAFGFSGNDKSAVVLDVYNESSVLKGRTQLVYDGTNTYFEFQAPVRFNSDNTIDIGTDSAYRPRSVYMGGHLALGVVSYAPSSGTKNNVSVADNASVIECNPSGNITITGFSGGYNGKILVVVNTSTNNITFNHGDAGSSTNNRINTGDAVARTITGTGSAMMIYIANRWRWISLDA